MGCCGSLSSSKLNAITEQEKAKVNLPFPVSSRWSWDSTTVNQLSWVNVKFELRSTAKSNLVGVPVGTVLKTSREQYGIGGCHCSGSLAGSLLGTLILAGGSYLAFTASTADHPERGFAIGGIALAVIGMIMVITCGMKNKQAQWDTLYPQIRQQYRDLLNNFIATTPVYSGEEIEAAMRASRAPAAVPPPAPSGVTLSREQFEELLAAARQSSRAAPPPMPTYATPSAFAGNDRSIRTPLLERGTDHPAGV